MKKIILPISVLAFVVGYAQKSDSLKYNQIEEVKIETKSILDKNSTDANKMPLDYLESPQVYNSVSSVVLDKQIAVTIEDAMKNIAGVTKLWDATGRIDGGSYFTSRGFYTSTKARNGLANIAATNIDMSNIERIEVIKGPSATLFGSIIPSYGGVINRITKKPFFHNDFRADFAYGGFNFYRGDVDANIVLDKKNTLAFRLNAAAQNQDSFQDQGFMKSYIIAPSLLYKPNDRLSVSLEAEILGSEGNSNGGSHVFVLTPSFINENLAGALSGYGFTPEMIAGIMAGAPKTFEEAYGTNKVDQLKLDYKRSYLNDDITFKTKNTSLFGTVDYKISEHWKSQTSLTYSRSTNSGYMGYQYLIPNYLVNFVSSLPNGNPSFGTAGHDYLARMVWKPGGSVSNYEIQQNFISDYEFGNNMRNRAVIGLDYSNFNSDIVYERFYGSLLGLPFPDVFDLVPSHGEVPTYNDFNLANVEAAFANNTSATLNYQYNNNIYSAYINDVFNINDFIILNAGLRLDHFQRTDKYGQEAYNQTKLAPKFGVVVSPIKDQLSIFANYQNGFQNKNGIGSDGKAFIPEESNQWEAGVKYDLFNKKLTGSISYYDVTVKNIVRGDVNDPLINIQNGEQRSKGIELEVLANPAQGLTMMFGYGYNDSKFQKAAQDVEGRRPQGSGPKNTFNFWTNYTFTSTALKGFGLGFSANYAGESYSISLTPDGDFIVPSYLLLGSHFTYDTKRYRLGIKINNLTNEKYWMGWTNLIPQMPRQLVATVGIKF